MANHFKENFAVIVGDVKTALDSNRIIKAGHKYAYPIETGGGCHISPNMINQKIEILDKEDHVGDVVEELLDVSGRFDDCSKVWFFPHLKKLTPNP